MSNHAKIWRGAEEMNAKVNVKDAKPLGSNGVTYNGCHKEHTNTNLGDLRGNGKKKTVTERTSSSSILITQHHK